MRLVWVWFGLNNGWGFPSKELADFFRQLLSGALPTRPEHVMKPTRVLCPLRRAQVFSNKCGERISLAVSRNELLHSVSVSAAVDYSCPYIFSAYIEVLSRSDCSTMHVLHLSQVGCTALLLLTRLWNMFLLPQPSSVLDANPKKSSLWSPQTTVAHMGYTQISNNSSELK